MTERRPPRSGSSAPAGRDADQSFPPQVLREYAVIADGYRGALIGPRGDIAWLCAPQWDSPAVLADLIGGAGRYSLTPTGRFVWGGSYEPGTLIWRARWVTTDSVIESREALAYPGRPGVATLLRRVEAVDGDADLDVVLQLSADFGRAEPQRLHRLDDGDWLIDIATENVYARLSGAGDAFVGDDGAIRLRLRLRAGDRHDLVLQIADRPTPDRVQPDAAWHETKRAWAAAVPDFGHTAAPRDTAHAYAVLRGLTMPGGGMVAATTLGLPERAEAGRNYDYRYVWLRDQAYAAMACAVDQPYPLLDEAVAFTTARVLEYGDRLAPAYTVAGRPLSDETTLRLPGYPGGRNVVGNWVNGQFQLDACGEILQLYAAADRFDRLQGDDCKAVDVVVDLIQSRWRDPDAGVWEIEDRWWTHSRLACVAGLRTMARQVARRTQTPSTPTASGRTSNAMTELADAILAETVRRSLGPDQVWRQRPDRPGTDAALLLPPVRGALSPADPRSLATLAAVEDQLVEDGYVYRYRPDERPLGEAEGAFLMCGFALCLANLEAGRTTAAFRWFERQRAAAGPPGLLAEEYDVRQRQLRGNLPQAFVHALLLECSQRLGRTEHPISTQA
jgi:hypothetical protein